MHNKNPSSRLAHIPGLDTLRFFAALWVAFSHGARLPMDKLVPSGPLSFMLQSLNNAAFNGVAAVMVFFVISGLVIHLPQAETNTVKLLPYLARRLLRILPPLYISMLLGRLIGVDLRVLHIAIYWSIYCEIAYYLAYPALLVGFRKFGIPSVLLVS